MTNGKIEKNTREINIFHFFISDADDDNSVFCQQKPSPQQSASPTLLCEYAKNATRLPFRRTSGACGVCVLQSFSSLAIFHFMDYLSIKIIFND